MTPLIPGVHSFEELFPSYGYYWPNRRHRGNPYLVPGSMYPFSGLPGTIDISNSRTLFVRPSSLVAEVSVPRMTNNSIGSFRAVQSAHWMKHGLLPVFVQDRHMIASVLLAFMPQEEHERFNK